MGTDEKYPLALPQGTILAGQYIIEEVLGQGGFGITYKASDYKTGQKVAVKEFFPDSMATRTQTTVTPFAGDRAESFAYGKGCFLQEAETLAEFIGNENIVRVHSYFEENGTAYFVMDFVEGISFDQYIKEHGGRISYEETEKILLPVMDALAAVHSRGIIHRDVTPDNIYITKDKTVKLLDFGAARYSLGDKSRSLDVVLKHGFAPKEQYTRRGKQGPFTDVYTLGASFYFAITGRRPPDSIDRMDEDELISPGNLGVAISESQEDAILKAMSVQPSERFQSMGAFKQALVATEESKRQVTQGFAPQTMEEPVQQRVFTVPASQSTLSEQYQTPIQSQPWQSALLRLMQGKKKWLIPTGIATGVIAVIVLIIAATFSGSKQEKSGNKETHYDMVDDYARETEPVTEVFVRGSDVEILGNTSNNLTQNGKYVCDGHLFVALPGMNGLLAYDISGENAFLLEKTGGIGCISKVGDQIYYLKNGVAYCANIDGTNKEKIPELKDLSYINNLYVSEDFYFVFQDSSAELQCIRRITGKVEGTKRIDEAEYFTFLDGYLYYVTGDNVRRLWRIPADNFNAEAEQVLGPEDNICNCYEIVSEGNYLYGIYEVTDTNIVQIFQYDTRKDDIVSRYEFVWEEWQGGFRHLNVCGQYVYFTFYDTSKYVYKVYRFKAEPEKDSFETQLIYEGTKDQNFMYLIMSEKNQSIVIYGFRTGSIDEVIRINMDGSGEAAIIDENLFSEN